MRSARRRGLALAALGSVGCPDYQVARIPRGDTYVQEDPSRPVDVLWIIDNSGTMSEEQALLEANFAAFADVLGQTGVDFQIGITTTDAEAEAGMLVGEVMTADTEDLDLVFAEQAAVGVQGDRYEMPLEVSRLSTSEPALSAGTDALFREEADLQIIVLTDEDDQSEDEVDAYLEHLQDFKTGETRARFSLIGGPMPQGCASAETSAEPAERLLQAVEATSGTFRSICEGDFEPVMKALAFGTTGMTDTYALTLLPDLDSLEVKVDNVIMHQRPHDGWQYDAGENAVIFEGLAIPRPGQVIDLTYYEILGSDEEGAS